MEENLTIDSNSCNKSGHPHAARHSGDDTGTVQSFVYPDFAGDREVH